MSRFKFPEIKLIIVIVLLLVILLGAYKATRLLHNNELKTINSNLNKTIDDVKNRGINTITSKKAEKNIKIQILAYHYIRDYINPKDEIGQNLSVSIQNFDRQMNELVVNGFTPISFDILQAYLVGSGTLPTNPIIISFDDGYIDAYTQALPILEKYHLTASFGIVIGFVGQPGYMDWNQIKLLKLFGNEIASHTISHADLTKLSDIDVNHELSNSKRILDAKLNQNTDVVIYPFGKYSDQIVNIAKSIGYTSARTTQYDNNASTLILYNLPGMELRNESHIGTLVDKPPYIKDTTPPSGTISCPSSSPIPIVGLSLKISDEDNSSQQIKMAISNSANFDNSTFENFATFRFWIINPVFGDQIVYVKLIDPSGNISNILTCTVNYIKI